MIASALDSLISVFSPRWGAQRLAYRQYASRISNASGIHESMRKLLTGRSGGYEAGKLDRLKGRTIGSPHENDVPRQQIHNMRWRAWNLYRNNPQARKIRRNLGANVIGRGLSPQPQAVLPDGKPFVEFRRRARQVWNEFSKECDFRGKPGSGGQHFVTLCKTALGANLLSGGVLYRFHHLKADEQAALGLHVPLQIQLIHVDRLDEQKHGGDWFYGMKLDDLGRVEGYQVLKGGVAQQQSGLTSDSVFVEVGEMRHLFIEEDIDQLLGSPWVGAALLTMDDRRNYEYSELIAAEMAACLVAGYRRSAGHTGAIGLQPESSDRLTDADGNPVTHLQPGMFLDLGQSGELQVVNPARPNASAGEFLAHFIRSEAVSVPGVKGSTLTGDYRNSSFSSEKSADNDVWPEIEELQDWFAIGFCQPCYSECITTAVLAGLFDDVPDFDAADFNARKRNYLETNWQGPVPRSINPKHDADSSRVRVKNGTSSPQREAAQVGRDWREVLQEIDEFIDYANELALPAEIWRQALGMEKAALEGAKPIDENSDEEQTEQEQQDEQEDEQEDAALAARLRGFVAMNRGA